MRRLIASASRIAYYCVTSPFGGGFRGLRRGFASQHPCSTSGKLAFEQIRRCGSDVHETLHDGHPTAYIGAAAFAYVDAFTAHVKVGYFMAPRWMIPAAFFRGAASE